MKFLRNSSVIGNNCSNHYYIHCCNFSHFKNWYLLQNVMLGNNDFLSINPTIFNCICKNTKKQNTGIRNGGEKHKELIYGNESKK